MRIEVNNEGNIEVIINANNEGKFRFKKRENKYSFGETFATRNNPFDKTTYLEWQISYDILEKEVKNPKELRIPNTFIASNGKKKYPVELSDIFYLALKQGLLSLEQANDLLREIESYNDFIDHKSIKTKSQIKEVSLNEAIKFRETSIELPTLFFDATPDETTIEISIKQQQYASGVQPMVYFCIPITSFINHTQILGKTSKKGDTLIYIFDKNNVQNLVNLVKVFGMASKKHHHDIIEITKLIISKVKKEI
ncbi:R.Pab1 family restriction endonuclease [Thermosyntropha sp.]|uniref:R.Pab1 family restriction endonuclease n=1 Tax=Thermosyntropha sp. TaxID=2740820 RepID=UPI0025EBC3A6|nr:R.Pab1 family restriction endonuclease [Thermosyntropha sp.]MBO8157962.1 R.Pab1 family restriction endonuclease [Thermosyntropha sp.]